MDQPRKPSQRTIVRSLVFLVGGIALGALWRPRRPALAAPEPEPVVVAVPAVSAKGPRRPLGARLGMAATFVALFVAGGALTAWGGNEAAQLVEDPAATAPVDATAAPAPEAATTDPAPAPAPVETAPSEPAAADEAAAIPHERAPEEDAAAPSPAPVEPTAPASEAPASALAPAAAAPAGHPAAAPVATRPAARTAPAVRRAAAVRPARTPTIVRAARVAPDPEVTAPGTASIVWLNRALPDPTPPSRRLRRTFVRNLVQAAGHDWPLELAVLRVQGADGRVPASPRRLDALAPQLAALKAQGKNDWQVALALFGDTTAADRTAALAHYFRAVGSETLVQGLAASRERLGRRLLADPRVTIYPGGRADVEAGRVNERVLAVVAYLADAFDGVEVTSLVAGHRLYARPRVISAHVYGDAVDVAALGGVSIAGHQEPGGLTELAVRDLLLLPAEVEPRQVISLLGLGGPSFAEADHADHIHVGF